MRAIRAGLKGMAVMALALSALSPQRAALGQTDTQTQDHIFQPGETNLDLELFYNLPKPDIEALNGEQNLALAGAGQPVTVIVNSPAPLTGVGGPLPDVAVPVQAPPQPPAQAPAAAPAQPVSSDPPGVYTVQRGDTLFRIATQYGLPLWAVASANNIQNPDTIFVGQQISLNFDLANVKPLAPAPTAAPPAAAPAAPAPQAPSAAGKQILVVLHEQTVYAYQDGQLLRQMLASTGLPGTPTVLGTYSIYVKYDAQLMTGPGYYLPGVPWVMYFYRGYALHGTYWHNNFGHPMSHGCVNLRTPEAEWLYEWAPVGTKVTVIS